MVSVQSGQASAIVIVLTECRSRHEHKGNCNCAVRLPWNSLALGL